MNNILTIVKFTLAEALARKVFLFFAAITLLVLLGTLLVIALVDLETLMGITKASEQNSKN